MINQENTVSREHHTLTLTYCGVSHECLPVGHHGVHRHLLVILTGDDRYSRLPTVLVPRPEEREAIIMTIDY